MPGLAGPAAYAGGTVGLVAHERRAEPVGHLAEQQQQPRAARAVPAHGVQEQQQVGEPHAGAQVIEEVADREAQTRGKGQRPRRPRACVARRRRHRGRRSYLTALWPRATGEATQLPLPGAAPTGRGLGATATLANRSGASGPGAQSARGGVASVRHTPAALTPPATTPAFYRRSSFLFYFLRVFNFFDLKKRFCLFSNKGYLVSPAGLTFLLSKRQL